MPATSSITRQIGRYQIIEELGRGGMGVVYRALDPAIGRTVAVKTVILSDAASPEASGAWKQRLLTEARSAGSLSHPHIVAIHDVGAENDYVYIVMEFVEGRTLEKVLSPDAPLRATEACALLRQIAETLDYLHAKGIVHRDLKPANILVQPDGTVKLADFGIAKILSDPNKLTRTGLVVGTPHFMSPEQIQGRPVSARSDQFSLAVLAYEMLTGQKPFTGDTLSAIVFSILGREPIAPQTLNPNVGGDLERVLKIGLAKDARDRYPTCTELVCQIEAALTQNSVVRPAISQRELVAASTPGTALRAAQFTEAGTNDSRVNSHRRLWAGLAMAGVSVALLLIALVFRAPSGNFHKEPAGPHRELGTAGSASGSARGPDGTGRGRSSKSSDVHISTVPRSPASPASGTAVGNPGQSPRSMPDALQKLQLFTEPPGARAVFDRTVSCTTPCTVRLSPGQHSVEVSLAGYQSIQEPFELPIQSELSFALHRLVGGVLVTSSPAEASISLNGELRSEKTPALLRVPAGTYQLELIKDGYKQETVTVIVEDRKGQFVHRDLVRR